MLIACIFLLFAHLPAFLCMPLDADVCSWDLYAQRVGEGATPYRDVLENNFPGMLWAHCLARYLVGWRSESLRGVDVAVVAAIVALLARWLPAGCAGALRLFTVFVLAAFYLTTSEWCHCQRDTWMLLPALLAAELRYRQLADLPAGRPSLWRGVVEGMLWGAAFWVKPFVAMPCVACWAATARRADHASSLVRDGAAVLIGGLLAGVAGCRWLLASGAWADFWDVMLVWNREYVGYDMGRDLGWLYRTGLVIRLAPWPLVHLAAAPIALAGLRNGASDRRLLLDALYLGWLAQAALLQHAYDYVHVPPLLLGIAVLCQWAVTAPAGLGRTLALALLLLGVGTRLPAVTAQRLGCWSECVRAGSTPALRDRLALLPRVNYEDLERVRAFLEEQGVGDGELTCLSMRTVPLYQSLQLQPSTRYLFLENILTIFVRQRDRVLADLAASQQRYVVCDTTATRWRGDGAGPDPIFRAGRYAVFAVRASDMLAWARAHFRVRE